MNLWGIIRGLLIQEETDRTKQLSVEVNSSATTGTRTTVQSSQTADRTLNLPDANDTLVGRNTTDTLTNKTIDGDDNTLQDIDLPSLKVQAPDAGKFLLRDGLGNVVSGNTVPNGTVVGDTDAQTLENKTIDGTSATGNNTITADMSNMTYDNSTSGLTATDGQAAVDEVEGRVDTVEANKIDGPGTHADNVLLKTDGVDSNTMQTTGILIDDSNNVTGVNDLTVNGNLQVDGTTTSVNSTTLDVTDANITVNNNGNDATAEGAGLTVERTGTDGSIVYEDALTSKFKIGALGSEVEVMDVSSSQTVTNKDMSDPTNNVDTASADSLTRLTGNQQVVTIPDTATPDNLVLEDFQQVLTNKDIDGQTASDTSRITLPKNTTAGLDALTDKEGTVAYDTDLDTVVYNDGAGWNRLSGGQGGVNYIENPDAETGTAGWNTYNDGTQIPIDGTGGTANAIVIGSTSGGFQLRGTQSFNFIQSNGASAQGQGFSTDFTIDLQDTNSTLPISFEYYMPVGGGNDYETNDWKVYIYDIDNATLLGEVLNDEGGFLISSPDLPAKFLATFNTTDSLNYRLLVHVDTANLNQSTVIVDTFKIGPETFSPATYEQSEIIDVTGSGDFTGGQLRVSRIGNIVSVTNVENAFTFPSQATPQSAGGLIPEWARPQNTTRAITDLRTTYMTEMQVSSAGTFSLLMRDYTGASSAQTSVGGGTLSYAVESASNVVSNTQLSQQTIRAQVYLSANQAINDTAENKILIDTVAFDPHSLFNAANNSIDIKKSGYYKVSAFINSTGITASDQVINYLRLNGSTTLARNVYRGSGFDSVNTMVKTVYLEEGDQLTITIDSNADSSYNVRGSSSDTYLEINSLPDFSTYGVVKTPVPAARALVSVTQNIVTTAATKIQFDSVDFDTHGAWDTSNYEYVVPESGIYAMNVAVLTNNHTVGNNIEMFIIVNGSGEKYFRDTNTGGNPDNEINFLYQLNKGDTVSLSIANADGNYAISTQTSRTYFAIHKVTS